jgi:hypothetical protein
MNPVFIFLVILLGCGIWLCLIPIFEEVGKFVCDVIEVIKDKGENE